MVMGDVFGKLVMKRMYDLKGSLYGRNASEKEKMKHFCVLKDQDFLDLKETVEIDEKDKPSFLFHAMDDSELLLNENLIDYSLLLGIVDEKV